MILARPHFVFGIVKAMVVKWGVLLCRLCSRSSAWIGQGEVLVTYRVLLGIWKHSGNVYLMLPGRAVVWLRKASKRHLRSACLSHLLVQKWIIFSSLYANHTQIKKLEIWIVRGERSGYCISHVSSATNWYSQTGQWTYHWDICMAPAQASNKYLVSTAFFWGPFLSTAFMLNFEKMRA